MAQTKADMRIWTNAARTFDALTLAQAKLHLRVDNSDDDALITSIVSAATDYVERRSNRSLCARVWNAEADRFPTAGREMVIAKSPFVSVQTLSYVTTNAATITLVQDTDYRVTVANDIGRIRLPLGATQWAATAAIPDAVRVTFTAGYATQALIPQGLVQAVRLMLGHLYENREAVSENAGSEVELAVGSLCSAYWMGDVFS